MVDAARAVERALGTLPQRRSPWNATKEWCEFRLRDRRSYEEIAGTEAFVLIQAVGLKSFPELTERQKKLLEERKREAEQERREMYTLAGEAALASNPALMLWNVSMTIAVTASMSERALPSA